jgi:hypothetical protein
MLSSPGIKNVVMGLTNSNISSKSSGLSDFTGHVPKLG